MKITKDEEIDKSLLQEHFTQIIGISNNGNKVYLQERSRYLNTIFVGKAGSGKTTKILPTLAFQDIENKNCGATIIVDNEDVAFQLFSIAKNFKRKVYFINPYMDVPFLYDFLNLTDYDYEFINDKVIDYKKAIKEKAIVIINMNSTKYSEFAVKIVSMILNQLQIDMTDTNETKKAPHFVYVDNFDMYIDEVIPLLISGREYNIGLSLFTDALCLSEKYFKVIEANVRNTFVLNCICEEDVKYFEKKFYYQQDISKFYFRKYLEYLYEILADGKLKTGEGSVMEIDNELLNEINKKAERFKSRAYKKIEKLKTKAKRMQTLKISNSNKVNDKININPQDSKENDIKLEPFIKNGFGIEELNNENNKINTPDNDLGKTFENQSLFSNYDDDQSDDSDIENQANKSIINQISIIDDLPKKIRENKLKNPHKVKKKQYISIADLDFDEEQ